MIKIFQIIILVILSLLMMSASCDKGSEGCTNTDACNYDSVAIVEDGSCQYPEENYDCKGNCLAEMDCMGVCGGTAETDCCEFCDSDNTNNPPEKSDGSCQDSITYYDEGDETRLTERWHRPRIDHNIELEKKYLGILRKDKKVIDIV